MLNNILQQGSLIISIILIGTIKCSDSQAECSKISDQSSCETTQNCKWSVNTSDIVCSNKSLGCESKTDKQSCESDSKNCQYQPYYSGGCASNRSVDCSSLSYLQCKYQGNRCKWLNNQKCENFSDGFNCSSKNEFQCVNSSNYCQASFQCKDTQDKTLCSFKSKSDCLTSNSFCLYSITSQQQCTDITNYCQTLSGEDCISDSQFCSFTQTTPSTCINKDISSICGSKSLTDCDKATMFCQRQTIPYSCVNKVSTSTCATNVNQESCQGVSSCKWVSDNCVAQIECSTLIQSDCELQQNTQYCNSNPEKTVCINKSDFGCSAYPSKSQCLQYQEYCVYQPMVGTCSSMQQCQNLDSTKCQNVSNKCSFQAEQGSCVLKDNLGCSTMSQADCTNNSYCIYQFLGCSDLPGDLCSQLNQTQCSSSSQFCQFDNSGSCSENTAINCAQYSKTDCENNEGCIQYPSTIEACLNKIDCKKLTDTDCEKQSDFCNYTPSNGSCVSTTIIDSSQFNNILEFYNKIQIIMLILFIFVFDY